MNLLKVMIVDDEVTVRQGIKNLINWSNAGFEVSTNATNGKEAIQYIPIFKPHIIITDLIMPEIDGVQLIHYVKKNYPGIEIIVISSYDTFYLVKECFRLGVNDYILKPELSPKLLLETIGKVASSLKHFSSKHTLPYKQILTEEVNRYLSGYNQTLVLTKIDEYLPFKNYCMFLTNEKYYPKSKNKKQYLKKISSSIAPTIANIFFETKNGDFGYIVSSNLPISIISSQLLNILKTDSKNSFESLFFTVSHFTDNLIDLLDCYSDFSQKSDEQYFYFSSQSFLYENQFIQYLYEDTTQIELIVSSLLTNNFVDGLQLIERYFKQLLLQYPHPNFLKNQVSSLFYTLFTVMEAKLGNDITIQNLKMKTINTLSNSNTIISFTNILDENIKLITEYILNIKNEDVVIKQIKNFIEENYEKRISLEKIAKKYHYSYQYLSSYFSSRMKLTFSEYLNTIRINKAKDLISNTEYSYEEIAHKVGYSDHSYFVKTFKRYVGTTPAKYKKGIK